MNRDTIYHYYSRPAWRKQWGAVITACLLFFFVIGIAAGMFATDLGEYGVAALVVAVILLFALLIPVLYRRYVWRYTIDDENIESRYGIIARDMKSIRIRDLRNINVKQSFFQRLFGMGDVEFSTAAGGGVEVVFFGVLDPLSVKYIAQNLQESLDIRKTALLDSSDEE